MATKWQSRGIARTLLLLSAVGMSGCDEVEDPNVEVLADGEVADDDHIDFTPVNDDITFRQIVGNGLELNGAVLNGARLNGARLNGIVLNAVTLLSSVLSDLRFTSSTLLSAYDAGSGSTRIGAQLNGTVLNLGFDPLNTGVDSPQKIRIKAVTQSATQSDVYFYEVESEVATNVFETICRDAVGNPVEAIAVPKAYDPVTGARLAISDPFTWACRGAALAKAIEWGYRPWVSAEMEDAHQATVHMIRADYCGDGTTHTTNGNPIDVSDKWGIQVPDTSWDIEAKWGPDGAVCLNTPRKLYHPRSSIPCAASLPYCTSNGLASGTPNTNPAQYGGLTMTRAVPNNNY